MKKEVFVTSELCKIRDQIAEAAKKNNDVPSENTASPEPQPEKISQPPAFSFNSLSEETRHALIARQEEYERFRKEVIFHLHEMLSECSKKNAEAKTQEDETLRAENGLKGLLSTLENMQEPDRNSSDFQLRLSENCRLLDHTRLQMIDLKNMIPETENNPQSSKQEKGNLFADMDSVSFSQMLRLGFALFLPLSLVLLLCGILLAAIIVLTFRVGL